MTDPEDGIAVSLTARLEKQRLAAITAIEDAFRRGYMRGYFAAGDDVEALKHGGYSRVSEVHNVLGAHARTLIDWRYGNDMDQEVPPPKLVVEPWRGLRHQVFRRDGRVCSGCGGRERLEIDHIKGVGEGGLPVLENLRVLCRTCNRARPRSRWVVR